MSKNTVTAVTPNAWNSTANASQQDSNATDCAAVAIATTKKTTKS